MKKLSIILLTLISTVAWSQQVTWQVVEAPAVPEAVRQSHQSKFPDGEVTRWEQHKAVGRRGNTGSKYVAVFKNNGQVARARYRENGNALSCSTYYGPAKAPSVAQEASKRYTGYRLMGGEEIQSLKNDKRYIRLRLRKGAQKLIVYLDAEGNELSKDKTPEEVTEGEDEEGGQ